MDTTRNGPLLAPGVMQGLASLGIDFSLPPRVLSQHLSNPQFTAYPALAQALLARLPRKLQGPAHLDVIVFKYESTPGVTSPLRAQSDAMAPTVTDVSDRRRFEIEVDAATTHFPAPHAACAEATLPSAPSSADCGW